MRSEMLSARIDADTKAAFTSICDEVGLKPFTSNQVICESGD